jgi:uncharacterized protein YcbX
LAVSVQDLFVYPVKSCRGVAVAESAVDRFGLEHDRAFMVVDAPTGVFLTQRDEPRLARIVPRFAGEALELSAEGAGGIRVPLAPREGSRVPVQVWRHQGDALDLGDEAAAWLSDGLGRALRLVRMPPEHARRVNPERVPFEAWTSFTDGYPFLVISQASLDDLNARLPAGLPMARFRPNLVVGGTAPHAEDGWSRIRAGALELADPATGERQGFEPLRTLARYRRRQGAVYFGQNAVHLGTGRLAVGMPVEVLATREPEPFELR